MPSVETLIFKRGRTIKRQSLKVVDNLLMDNKARRSYIIGSSAVPILKNTMGFLRRGRLFMVNETVTDVIPLSRKGYKRTDKNDVFELEDLGLYREQQRLKSGDSEPSHAKIMSYGIVLLIIGVLAVGGMSVAQWVDAGGLP